jgi:hypothetical protein
MISTFTLHISKLRLRKDATPSTQLAGWNIRAVAHAVRRWLPTAAAWVRVRAEHVGFVVDKGALGQVFSEYFGFP